MSALPSELAGALADLDAGEAQILADTTRRNVTAAFNLAESRNPHAPGVSLSKLGGCDRQIAFTLAGTEPTDPDLDGDKRQATLGTWAHRGFLPNLRLILKGARTEVPVTLSGGGLTLPGQVDLWQRRTRGGDVVYDVKTVKEWGLNRVRRDGARDLHLMQVFGYALALKQSRGADVRWVVVIYVDRATGDVETVVHPFGPAEAAMVLTRLSQIAKWRDDPLDAERSEDGPGLSWLCDHCTFLRACWGENAAPGDTSVMGLDPAEIDEIALACAEYAKGRELAAEGDKLKDRAKALLSTVRKGTYHGWRLGWRGGGNGSEDHAGAWDALVAAGVDLPGLMDEKGIDMPWKPGRRASIDIAHVGEVD